ncbi:glycoside hydrolase family 43 protein [Enterococcus gallinarum]|uniref:Glycoside hydrolase family 43 protein n=1 Tax=Enterococcus gallinarum TaxID=1353 RepID=A0ABD4HMV0_ENTGA|nr:glycoside hydrolase family 43 protein [Enterococcus gallinarum]MBA0948495.1 glycoside hydrolase family 43 protein [Enterococcus gallinarum]MBA0961172.1 glycoside hydrolase family 43 protein [Enterococcus gallinarum]MBA0969385.1 glycoside hydrolase family 43 protein [Enterococcus gallinarum]MBA0972706.1 glycoside hydrolase family 43 protein [Enterococcus gallinarum]MBO6418650.1 glycoside hydrolase family 43 protein [Enterococcus gallinarum]
MKIKNPVLPGFNADPSIIRVEDTYYIANSTFEWFPGVRLHESKDLVHWNLLPSPLSTTTLLDMKGNPSSGGIWAPDLSYADGKFWLVYTDVKVVDGAFKDMTNYLTTATDIKGPWTDPVKLNGVGFDASLFHDEDNRKYLVQQTWDHREYHHPFDGITLTEFDTQTMKLKPDTARTIYRGTAVKLVEGPHLYKINGYYYLFAAEGGTVFTHQEVVARSKTLEADSFETEPDGPFLTNFDTPNSYLQKQGHGALVDTPSGEWYYASLAARPWHHPNESITDPRGWSTLGRETSIQKVEWDQDGWPRIVGGHGGTTYVDAPKDAILTEAPNDHSQIDDFQDEKLDINWNTLRVPFSSQMGRVGNGQLKLIGRGSLANCHDLSMIARRWQAFYFDAVTKVKFSPFSYQQMAGLTNYYNDKHWSFVFVTWNEINGTVIEVAENNRGVYTSYLKDAAINVPEGIEYVWFKTKARKQTYTYEYSFDGNNWQTIPVTLNAAVLSDDYVLQTSGGFFTGAFVGLAAVDYSGYETEAQFDFFEYKEYGDEADSVK